ncbi:MAG: GntR family transcriptional regulator [Candidatus Hydrogenedentes bacterium]|nr:GntR family transcriptional regulator [Candidatus Hydrogenedentota bacterium]
MIKIDPNDGTPIYLQIVRQIKYMIASGAIREDDELPPVRVLAQQLVINPNTVAKAYRELEFQGLIYTRPGAGTYVAKRRILFSDEERLRIIQEKIESLIVEAQNLNFTLEELAKIFNERLTKIYKQQTEEKGNERD